MATPAELQAAIAAFLASPTTTAFLTALKGDKGDKGADAVVTPPAPPPPAPAPQPPVAGTVLAAENGTFTVPAATSVKFGTGTSWATKNVAANTPTLCDPTFFGDPAPGQNKSCVSNGAATAVTPPAPPPTPPPVGQDAITTNGVIDPVKYVQVANLMSADAGIAYRFGNPSTIPDAGLPTWYEPPSTHWPSALNQEGYYQLGSYVSDPTDYASNCGHVGFVADNPSTHIGAAGIQCTNVSHMVFAMRPELSWTLYGAGMNGVEAAWWKTHSMTNRPAHPTMKNPVCAARAFGRPTWGVPTIFCFQDGWICTVGANTMTNHASCQLDPGKVPTAIAVTSSCEFALVTVWDTINKRGELAVIALTGLGGGCTIENPYSGDPEGAWGEWNEPHPGIANIGNYAWMKVIGYMPLPGMMAPTGVSTTTGHDPNWYARGVGSGDETTGLANFSNEAIRLRWGDPASWQYRHYAKQGIAVVISKTEKRALFINLKPLIDYYLSMYFGTRAQYLETTNIGDAAGKWPYTFTERPQQMPVVVKTIDYTSKPTSCLLYLYGANPRSWVGTEDGKLHVYDLGGFPQAINPANIKETATVEVGPNPTCITPIKDKAFHSQVDIVKDYRQEVAVCSRGDRAIRFVAPNSTGAGWFVRRTFQDKRMKDPISIDDTDNHGTEHYIVFVADYSGKQVLNFRYGPIIMHTNGGVRINMGGPGKNEQFEFSGAMAFPGKPFHAGNANIS